jgi:hypothetical protein
MEVDLIITRNGYGFGYDWQLEVTKGDMTKVFYLGQDAKVCSRILGMRPSEVADVVGSNDLTLKETRESIADLILEAVGVTEENEDEFFNLQPWEIAAE